MNNATTCPACGSAKVWPIIWGEPPPPATWLEQYGTTELAIGGCVMSDDSPDLECQDCQHRYSKPVVAPLEGPALQSFKDRNRALQYLVKELTELRTRNLALAEAGEPFKVQLFAEGAVGFLAFEHFLRAILVGRAKDGDTFFNLLQMAVSEKNGGPLLVLPWDTQENGCRELTRVRNTLMHGNFEQAAREAGKPSVAEYFQTVFAAEVEKTYQVLDEVMKQINRETGRRHVARR